MIYIPRPNMAEAEPARQLMQIRSYLYQLSEQLEYAFQNIDKTGNSGGVVQSSVQRTGNVDNKKTPVETFSEIKSLIIKSADIVNAYSAEITRRLEGVYLGMSEFGTYVEKTSQQIRETSSDVTNLFSNLREISETVDGLYNAVLDSNAYIKTGLLYEERDGRPVYGLEIGQTNSVNGEPVFDKFARFSADRLSFFDSNDVEVAYISDYKLYITHAEITGSLRIVDRFKIFYANGLAFQWIGGNE